MSAGGRRRSPPESDAPEPERKSRGLLSHEVIGRIVTRASDAGAAVPVVYFDPPLKDVPADEADDQRRARHERDESKARATREARHKLSRQISWAFTAERVQEFHGKN